MSSVGWPPGRLDMAVQAYRPQRSGSRASERLSSATFVLNEVCREGSGYSSNARLVAMAIAKHLGPFKEQPGSFVAFPSRDLIQRETGLGRTAVARAIRELKCHGAPLFIFTAPKRGTFLVTNGFRHASSRIVLVRRRKERAEHVDEIRQLTPLQKRIGREMALAQATAMGQRENRELCIRIAQDVLDFFDELTRLGFALDSVMGQLEITGYLRIEQTHRTRDGVVNVRWPTAEHQAKWRALIQNSNEGAAKAQDHDHETETV
jgi:hypothetical protein